MQICTSKDGLREQKHRNTVEQSAKQNWYRQFNLKNSLNSSSL